MKKATRHVAGKSNILGEKIKQVRVMKDLTQEDVSERLKAYDVKLEQRTISSIERGSRTISDFEALAFANSLEVSIAELYSDEPYFL